jgi:anti-sigma factor RsiW
MCHAVEVAAADRDHLLSWLSKRIGTELTAPDLAAKGLNLVGGRLLPFGDYSMAQFMYEDANKRRLTLYMAGNPQGRDSAFRIEEKGGITTCYWNSGPLAYALAGSMARDELISIAQVVYEALEK